MAATKVKIWNKVVTLWKKVMRAIDIVEQAKLEDIKVPEELWKRVIQDKEFRLAVTKKSLFLYTLYYLWHYIKNKPAKFHNWICRALSNPLITNILMVMFRWSAKTTFVKADFLRNITFKLRNIMLWSAADWWTARNNLFDIALELQTNKRIHRDFWNLYFWDDWDELRTSKKTAIWNFKTSNWVRVMATAIWGSLRWTNFKWDRPDYIVFDDIETNVTIRRASTTINTKNYIDETYNAMAPWAKVIVLWNRITDTWVVSYVEEKFMMDPKNSVVIEVAAIENWKSTWPDRFVLKDSELDMNRRDKMLSLESIKRVANANWRKVFEQEYLNIPLVDWDRFFDIELLDANIKYIKENIKKVSERSNWKWKIWKKPEKMTWTLENCRYIIAVDTSMWYWIDHSVIEVVNVDTNEQVAEYCNNLIPPEQLVLEIIWAHDLYNNAPIVPENNWLWRTVVALLKDKWYWQYMPMQTTVDRVRNTKVNKYWWNTNGNTKPKMLFNLQKDFNDWTITINSISLLREMKMFTNNDVQDTRFDATAIANNWAEDEPSNHFDRLMAFAIRNENRRTWFWFSVSTTDNQPKVAWKTVKKIIPKSRVQKELSKWTQKWNSLNDFINWAIRKSLDGWVRDIL